MIYVITGQSSSGKDYIMKKMVADYNIQPIVSFTTRPKRDGETNKMEYEFVSREQFEYMIKKDLLIEYRTYETLVDNIPDTWYYGLGKELLPHDLDYVVILDIQGAKDFVKYYGTDECRVIYVHCDDNVRRERAETRGSFSEIEWSRRFKTDKVDFSYDKLEPIVDKFVDNTNANVDNIIKEIIR